MPKLKNHVVLPQDSTKPLHIVMYGYKYCWNSVHSYLRAGGKFHLFKSILALPKKALSPVPISDLQGGISTI